MIDNTKGNNGTSFVRAGSEVLDSGRASTGDEGPRVQFEIIDSKELGRRLALPESWIRDQVRRRAQQPIPHLRFGKYVRFRWGSPELQEWLQGRIIGTNNRSVRRAR